MMFNESTARGEFHMTTARVFSLGYTEALPATTITDAGFQTQGQRTIAA